MQQKYPRNQLGFKLHAHIILKKFYFTQFSISQCSLVIKYTLKSQFNGHANKTVHQSTQLKQTFNNPKKVRQFRL